MAKNKKIRAAYLRVKIEEMETLVENAEADGDEQHADDLRCNLADLKDELKELEAT